MGPMGVLQRIECRVSGSGFRGCGLGFGVCWL